MTGEDQTVIVDQDRIGPLKPPYAVSDLPNLLLGMVRALCGLGRSFWTGISAISRGTAMGYSIIIMESRILIIDRAKSATLIQVELWHQSWQAARSEFDPVRRRDLGIRTPQLARASAIF
jgi:hypothetical protein